MCGRYAYFPREFSDLRLTWNVDEVFDLKPRYNIAPTQEAPVIVHANGKRTWKGDASRCLLAGACHRGRPYSDRDVPVFAGIDG
jgi:putative SOS response-associated peptidase YedK